MPAADPRRARIIKIATSLPEAEATQTGALQQHTSFRVRSKAFAYYVVNEHDDGRIAVICKAAPGEQARLVAGDPKRYYLPQYMAHRGWVCLDLDAGKLDWREVARLLTESYRLIAPKRLAALVAG
jgi:phosphoribosylglycinamide formyltransferase-1